MMKTKPTSRFTPVVRIAAILAAATTAVGLFAASIPESTNDFEGEDNVWGNEGPYSGNSGYADDPDWRRLIQGAGLEAAGSPPRTSRKPAPEPFLYITSVRRERAAQTEADGTAEPAANRTDSASTLSSETGTITSVHHVNTVEPTGESNGLSIVQIELADGSGAGLSLDWNNGVEDRNTALQAGDEVTLLGWRAELEGETVFVARRLQIGSTTTEVDPVTLGNPVANEQEPTAKVVRSSEG